MIYMASYCKLKRNLNMILHNLHNRLIHLYGIQSSQSELRLQLC